MLDEQKIREDERHRIEARRAEADIRKQERAKALYEGLTEAEKKARQAEYEAKEKAAREEQRTADRDFAKVYSAGFERIRHLIFANRSAAVLYTYLAQHLDASTGSVVASQEVLSEETGLSRTTLWRASKYLESNEVKALVRIKVGGSVWAYCLNPTEVWKSWDNSKPNAAFLTRTLVKKTDRDNQNVKRRLQVMMKEINEEPELPF